MKTLSASIALLFVSAALWVSHLPSPHPINGSFLVMCAATGMTLKALAQVEVTKR